MHRLHAAAARLHRRARSRYPFRTRRRYRGGARRGGQAQADVACACSCNADAAAAVRAKRRTARAASQSLRTKGAAGALEAIAPAVARSALLTSRALRRSEIRPLNRAVADA